eukprot:4274269-Amphidinium_carterae.2
MAIDRARNATEMTVGGVPTAAAGMTVVRAKNATEMTDQRTILCHLVQDSAFKSAEGGCELVTGCADLGDSSYRERDTRDTRMAAGLKTALSRKQTRGELLQSKRKATKVVPYIAVLGWSRAQLNMLFSYISGEEHECKTVHFWFEKNRMVTSLSFNNEDDPPNGGPILTKH